MPTKPAAPDTQILRRPAARAGTATAAAGAATFGRERLGFASVGTFGAVGTVGAVGGFGLVDRFASVGGLAGFAVEAAFEVPVEDLGVAGLGTFGFDWDALATADVEAGALARGVLGRGSVMPSRPAATDQ